MDKLLPYYERELALLRHYFAELVERYPEQAGALGMAGDHDVGGACERLLQGIAFLGADMARQLEDGHARFTSTLLGAVAFFYLRPLPACSVVQVGGGGSRLPASIPRGTELRTKAAPACRFRTVYDVIPNPVAITDVRFALRTGVPHSLRLPAGAGCAIALTVESTDPSLALAAAASAPLRVFVDGDDALRAALLDALLVRKLCICVESGQQWSKLDAPIFTGVGLADDEALLPVQSGHDAGLRLLTEYFALPEKFDFIDIDLRPALDRCPADTRRLVLHVILPDLNHTPVPRLLQGVSAQALKQGCTPVVNLFERAAAPIRVLKGRNCYPLAVPRLADAPGSLYSVDAVKLLRRDNGGSRIVDMVALHGQRHGDGLHYWLARYGDASACTEDTLSFVDIDERPLCMAGGTVNVQMTCTNGELPGALASGRPDGDLNADQVPGDCPIRLLRKPTRPRLVADEGAGHWKLIAAHAPGSRALSQSSLPALLAILQLHAGRDSAAAERQLAGIVGLECREEAAWLKQKRGATLGHGLEVRLTIDEQAFAGRSLFAFAQVLNYYLGYHTIANSFTQLVVLDQGGKERLRFPVRPGTASQL